MQSTLRNRNSTFGNNLRVLPLCKEIRQFAEESRRCQTVYANFEGQFPERLFSLQQEADIENYIKETALSKECSGYTDLPRKFARKICDLSSRFGMSNAKFFLIWVYFFNYISGRMETTIFVKVFGNNEKYYFDCDLEEYLSWDLCVEKCKLPSSFACFPRDGEYVFRDDKLDLEFVCKSAKSESLRQYERGLKCQPWSQRVLFPALERVSKVILENEMFHKTVQLILSKLLPRTAAAEIYLSAVGLVITGIWGFKIGQKIWEDRQELFHKDFKTSVKTIIYILLDMKIPDYCYDKFCLSPVERSPKDNIVSHSDFLETFSKLLENVKENFMEIVKTVLKAMICSWEEMFILAVNFLTPGRFATNDVQVILNFIKSILNTVSPKEMGEIETNRTQSEVNEVLDQAENGDISRMLTRRQENVTPLVAITLQINCFGYEVNIFRSASVSECRERLRSKLKADVKLEKYSFYYQIMKNDVEVGVVAFVTQSVVVVVFKDQ